MKCIRFMQDGKMKVQRVNDETALQLVHDGRAEFAPKKEWKDEGRKYYHGK